MTLFEGETPFNKLWLFLINFDKFYDNFFSDFRTGCFASTQCKVFAPNETWPLAPYCGRARCVALRGGNEINFKLCTCYGEIEQDLKPA